MAAKNALIRCNLRHVIHPARRIAWSWYKRDDYWPALRELIAAGNYGLLVAAKRFRPSEGVRFVTASKGSIRKELIRQAKFDKERAITRPYDEKPIAALLLDGLRGTTDDEIEIADGEVHAYRSLCIIPNDEGNQPDGRSFSDVLAEGLAKLNDVVGRHAFNDLSNLVRC